MIELQHTPSGKYLLIDEKNQIIETVGKFLDSLTIRGLSPLTLRAYAYDLLALYRWLVEAHKVLETLCQADLLGFISFEQGKGLQPKSLNRRLATIRTYFRFCTGQRLDQVKGVTLPPAFYRGSGRDRKLGLFQLKKPTHCLLRVKEPHKLIEPLNPTQVRLLLRSLRKYRDIAIMYLMLLCGLRSREVLAVNLSDLCFEQLQLRVQGKGGKERLVPLPQVAGSTIRRYLTLERPSLCTHQILFVVLQGRCRGAPMTAAGLRSLFRHRRSRIRQLAYANPHRLRHTFGTEMARHGVRLPTLQRLMGHSHPTITLQYINLSLAEIQQELQHASNQIQKQYESDS